MDPGQVLGELQRLVIQVTGIANVLFPFAHPNLVVRSMLQDSVGLILNVWFRFILQTTDFDTTHDFTANATIQAFEPKVQIVANAALALMALWASYRIMWTRGPQSLTVPEARRKTVEAGPSAQPLPYLGRHVGARPRLNDPAAPHVEHGEQVRQQSPPDNRVVPIPSLYEPRYGKAR